MWNVKKLLGRVPFVYLIFALLSNILPYCRPVRVSDAARDRLDRVDFYGGTGDGVDRVTLLETPTEALESRLAVLRSAQQRIDLVYYKAVSDASTDAVLGELLLAADRGVRVRVLMDGRVGLSDRRIKGRLELLQAHPGVTVKRYNPVHPLRPWEWHSVLHDKFIAVDDAWLLLGGRNLGDRYYAPQGYEDALTNDRDVLVWRSDTRREADGSVLHQAARYMDRLWECAHVVGIAGRDPAGTQAQRRELLAAVERFERDNPRFYAHTIEFYRDRTVPTKKITLLTNPVHTGKKEPELAYQMRRIALTAQERVVVQTPYSTANADLLRTMQAVCANTPDAVMLTNSLASSPNYPAYTNYYSQRASFAGSGLQIYEYQSADSIHGKSMLVDERISVVGSFNLDDRSMYIDTESMLVIDSGEFAEVLADAMEDIRRQSLLVDGTGRGYAPQQAVQPAPPGGKKAFITGIVSPFSRLFGFLA